MSSRRLWITAAAAAALAGCNTANSHIGDEAASFGEAMKYDAAIQTINPAPVYSPEASQPGDNGEKGAGNVQKYRKGQVKDVQTMETTSGGGGGQH
jgi:type IV pilus biogenesis protein CpaD/CtpE